MHAMLNICGHLSNLWFSFLNQRLRGWAQIVFGLFHHSRSIGCY